MPEESSTNKVCLTVKTHAAVFVLVMNYVLTNVVEVYLHILVKQVSIRLANVAESGSDG